MTDRIGMQKVIAWYIQTDTAPGGRGLSPGWAPRRWVWPMELHAARYTSGALDRAQRTSLSTGALLVLLSAYMRVLSRAWPIASRGQALQIGFVWAGLTIAFEFGLGRLVAQEPWSELLEQYKHRTRQGLGADSRLGRNWPGGAPRALVQVALTQADRQPLR